MSRLFRLLAGALLIVSVLAGSLALAAGPAVACSCVTSSREALDDAAVVFTGTVRRETGLSDGRALTVAVESVFRGSVRQRQDVVTPERASACGLEWRVGDDVIAAGNAEGNAVRAGLCGGSMSARLDATTYDRALTALGEGEAPLPGVGKAERAGLTYDQWRTGRFVLGGIGLLVLAVAAFRAVRAWRARRRTSEE